QLVVAARLADGAADRVAQNLGTGLRLRIAVLLVDPAVLVPIRVGLDVVAGASEPVRSALGHGGDLQAARAAVLGLVALRQNLDLADRVDVHVQHLAVVAGVHRRDAVHHDVVLPEAAEAGAAGGGAAGNHARREGGQAGEVPARDRQVLDLIGGHGVGALAALGLDHRRFGGHRHGLGAGARFEGERGHADAVAAADRDAGPLDRLERLERDLHRIGV